MNTMKLPDFDHSRARWDKWRAFHIEHRVGYQKPIFTQFDTGELVTTISEPAPEYRRVYRDLNVQIFKAEDSDAPQLTTPGGEKVRRTWIPGQYFLADLDTRHVVCFTWNVHARANIEGLPKRFDNITSYFAGPGQPPRGRAPATTRPKKFTPEERDKITCLKAGCQAWLAMVCDGEEPRKDENGVHIHTWELKDKYRPDDLLKFSDYRDMNIRQRLRLLNHGVTANYETIEYPYLLLA